MNEDDWNGLEWSNGGRVVAMDCKRQTRHTCAAAWANTCASGLVDAPFMYMGLEKRLEVPQSSFTPVSVCSSSIKSEISSKFAFVSAKVAPTCNSYNSYNS